MSGLLVMQSQSFIKFWEFFGGFFKHNTEIIKGILLIQILDDNESSVFLVNNFIFSLLFY
jgi:hypothetical protein